MKSPKAAKWPRRVTVGNVTIPVYRMRHETSKSGWTYVVAFMDQGSRHRQKFSEPATALDEARLKAAQINAGRVHATGMTLSDRDELRQARAMVGETPLLSVLREWKQIQKIAAGNGLAAAEAWAARNVTSYKPVSLGDAVDEFIRRKEKAGKQGERTYRAKLNPLVSHFTSATRLDTISSNALESYLAKFENGVTRNDHRKRAVALWRWAQKTGRLPRGVPLEIEQTERAAETATEIGIINAAKLADLLKWVRSEHPEHLAAVTLAAFCGIRADEIHGKRANREHRQLWSDIYMDERRFVRVTVAKKNTPAWRFVPLCESAVEWLMLCEDRTDAVCQPAALEKLRTLARKAGFALPENCLRHSFITYRIGLLGDKARVATEAGNSVGQIDKHYRVPVTPEESAAWFETRPQSPAAIIDFAKAR
jgi:hypothetical protein